MENSQINEAQREYEAGLEGSQPTTAPTDYELADKIEPHEWLHDFAEYLMGKNDGELLTLLAYIKVDDYCDMCDGIEACQLGEECTDQGAAFRYGYAQEYARQEAMTAGSRL